MKDVRVISFDIGNTLLRLGGNGFCVDFAVKTGLSIEVLRPLIYEHFLTQRRSLNEAVFSLCRVIGFENPQKLVDEFQPAPVSLFEDTIPALDHLRAKGITMVAMSNCTPWEAGGLEALGLGQYLEDVFYSFAIGAAKPDPAMFRHVQKALGVSPANIVHVGDSSVADIDGARAVGWKAVLLDRTSDRNERRNSGADVPVVRSLLDLMNRPWERT